MYKFDTSLPDLHYHCVVFYLYTDKVLNRREQFISRSSILRIWLIVRDDVKSLHCVIRTYVTMILYDLSFVTLPPTLKPVTKENKDTTF